MWFDSHELIKLITCSPTLSFKVLWFCFILYCDNLTLPGKGRMFNISKASTNVQKQNKRQDPAKNTEYATLLLQDHFNYLLCKIGLSLLWKSADQKQEKSRMRFYETLASAADGRDLKA